MELIKRKISLEDYTDRRYNSATYGSLTATSFYIGVSLYQDMKDMGMFTPLQFIPKDDTLIITSAFYQPLYSQVSAYGFNFYNDVTANFVATGDSPSVRYAQKTLEDYIHNGVYVSGLTSDRLDVVSSYGFTGNSQYRAGFDVIIENYTNFLGNLIDGRTRVVSNANLNPIIYTEDANISDPNSGTTLQSYGILFKTFTGITRVVADAVFGSTEIPLTEVYYSGQSFNETNVGLSALTREEYLLHITQPPKVDSDVFIDRGATTVLQSHLQLAEINSLEHQLDYGNWFYNFIR